MTPAASVVAGAVAIALLSSGCTGTVGLEPTPTPPAHAPSATPSPSFVPMPTPTPTPVLGAFDAAVALAFAVDLADRGARHAGTEGEAQARALFAAALESAGWVTFEEAFDLPQGGRSANVIAMLDPGHRDGPHVVVGGHLDTIGGSPGANDNASGVGVLVALASEIADEAQGVPVVIVGFGAEEYQPSEPREHHLGSQQYAAAHADRVLAMLSVDMVGNGDTTCLCWFNAGPDTLVRRLEAVADAAGLTGFAVEARGDISDHGPFARRGVPAVLLWTGNDGRLHTPADTAEHLREADIQRAGDLVLAFLRSLENADLRGLRGGL